MKSLSRARPVLAIPPTVVALLLASLGDLSCTTGSTTGVSTATFRAYLADSTVTDASCVTVDATQNQLLLTTGSGTAGHMSFTVTPAPAVNDWVLLECTGGSYRDPATGATVVLSADTPYNVTFSISGSTMTFGDGTILTKQ